VFSSTSFQIKELVCMTENKFKKHISNIMSLIFVVLKIFNIQTRDGRMVSSMDVYDKFHMQIGLR